MTGVGGWLWLLVLCAALGAGVPRTDLSEREREDGYAKMLADENLTDELVGGWTRVPASDEKLSPEDQEIFESAVSAFPQFIYTPEKLLGTQVVAGVNLAYLCRRADAPSGENETWRIVVIYKNLDGDATVTSDEELSEEELKLYQES